MSLLETYQSRKNLIASNLTAMGVTASGDEGLTTLANKILEISPVGPVPDSIDLTGTKSILSFADSEQSVLTATVLDEDEQPVEGVSVSIYKGTDLWYTANTDSNGEVSKTYDSAGVGDIVFEAKVAKSGSFLTKTFSIEDIFKYAPTEISKTSSSSSTTKIFPYDFALDSEHFELLVDVKYPSNTFAIGLSPSTNSNFQYNIGTGVSGSPYKFRTWKPTSATTNEGTDSSKSMNLNTYYTLKYVYDNGSVSIYADNTLLITYTGMNTLYANITKTFALQSWGTGTIYLKNLKVRTL